MPRPGSVILSRATIMLSLVTFLDVLKLYQSSLCSDPDSYSLPSSGSHSQIIYTISCQKFAAVYNAPHHSATTYPMLRIIFLGFLSAKLDHYLPGNSMTELSHVPACIQIQATVGRAQIIPDIWLTSWSTLVSLTQYR